MRRRITYANVAATLALVFSMSGGAIAANHYLISSTKQISPKVLKKLKGATGKAGAAGAPGVTGKEGSPGKEGAPGKTGERGPSDVWQVGDGSTASSEPPLSLSLPAGSYLVQAKTVIDGGKGDDVCNVSAGGTADRAYGATSETATGIPQMTLNNLATITLSSPGKVELSCTGSASNFFYAKMTAIQVGTLH